MEAFGIEPFASLSSSPMKGGSKNRFMWMNYFVPVIYSRDTYRLLRTSSGSLDKLLLRLLKAIAGRYVFYVRQDRFLMTAQLVLNGLFSFRLKETFAFLGKLRTRGATLRGKRLAFDNGHFREEGGEVICADPCPNPTVRNGRIVPVCLADYLPDR